jgi:hypothetical protein
MGFLSSGLMGRNCLHSNSDMPFLKNCDYANKERKERVLKTNHFFVLFILPFESMSHNALTLRD